MSGKVLRAGLIILIFTVILVQIVPSGAVANPEFINIDLDFNYDQTPIADVKPGAEEKVVYYGNLSVKMNMFGPLYPVKIELLASTSQGWNCTVTPSTFSIPPGTGQPFTIELTIPFNASYYTSGQLSIYCKASAFPDYVTYQGPPITSTIKVRQFQNYTVVCKDPVHHAKPGSREWFEISVTNTGNAREKIFIEIENLDELNDKDIVVTLQKSKIELQSYTKDTVRVGVTVPKSAKSLGEHEIVVKTYLMSGSGEIGLMKNLTLQLEVPEEYIIYTTEFFVSSTILIVIIFCLFFIWQLRRVRKKRNIKRKKT